MSESDSQLINDLEAEFEMVVIRNDVEEIEAPKGTGLISNARNTQWNLGHSMILAQKSRLRTYLCSEFS